MRGRKNTSPVLAFQIIQMVQIFNIINTLVKTECLRYTLSVFVFLENPLILNDLVFTHSKKKKRERESVC